MTALLCASAFKDFLQAFMEHTFMSDHLAPRLTSFQQEPTLTIPVWVTTIRIQPAIMPAICLI